ncbi:MAG TPA: hypothetical protein VK961_26890 [Chthoniobacter sp.]|nr:hypothetical protein [Chthoniobacter sp.]
MAWITFTSAMVPVTEAEIAKIDTAVGHVTLDDIAGRAAARVQSFVPGTRGEAGTIPSEMADQCGAIAAFRFLSQIPTARLVTKPRTDANEQAEKDLVMLANGKITIAPPETAAPIQASNPSPSFSGRRRKDQRQQHGGF